MGRRGLRNTRENFLQPETPKRQWDPPLKGLSKQGLKLQLGMPRGLVLRTPWVQFLALPTTGLEWVISPLCFSFLICKQRIIQVPISKACVGSKSLSTRSVSEVPPPARGQSK